MLYDIMIKNKHFSKEAGDLSLTDKDISVKIESVSNFLWPASCVDVCARPYHALVLRNSGCAQFSHENLFISSNAGDITYMPSDYFYHALYNEANNVYAIHFISDYTGPMENLASPSSDSCAILFKEIFDTWNSRKPGYYFNAVSIFYKILYSVVQNSENFYDKNRYPGFFSSVEYIKTHFAQDSLTVSKLSEMANMSETYFRRLFYKNFFQTPTQYITKLKLKYAEELLSSGKYSIEETAYMSGFSDAKYFSRVIKSVYGYPPSKLLIHNKK